MSNLSSVIAALQAAPAGTLTLPGDTGFDAARAVIYGGIDKRPGAIVRVGSAADIQRVVTLARESGIELAVRSGGHSIAGHSSSEGGLVVDLRDLKAIALDVPGKTVWAETGVTAEELTRATTAHNLVVGFGDAGTVGIGGITLGGGVGYLARKHGLTIDSLLAAEIVTADGAFHMVDETHEPDLFWALRGGGGNFGIVTRLKFQLHDLPAFTGGMLCIPATPETLAGFIAAAEAAPEALSTIANVMPAPPMPFLPAEVHGKLVILGMLAFAGPDEAAEQALRPFRVLAEPHADFVKPGPYLSMYPPEDPDYHPTATVRTLFMDRVGLAEAKTILETLQASDATFSVAQLRVLGGAAARVPADATAYAHRTAPIMVNVAAFWTTPEDRLKQDRWVDEFSGALRQSQAGAYVNFLGAEPPERIRAAYPGPTWDRLRAIKRRYDPTNLFRLNQTIPPADTGA